VLEREPDNMDELGRRIDELGGSDASRSWFCVTQAIFTDESGEVKRAREMWTDCLGKYPAVPDVVFSAIGFYDAQQEPQRSIEVLRAALAADPSSQTFRSQLAERLRAAGNTAEGDALLMEATSSKDPSVATVAWLEVGRLRRNAQDPGGAADAMGRAYEVGRKAGLIAPQLLFEYAEALMLSQQFDRALEIASEIKVPAQEHLIRARVEQERGRFKEALAEYDETFRIWPDNPWARYYAARAAENAGDFDRAIEEYRTSIRIDGGATDVRTRAGALLFAEGKDRSAAQMLRQPAGQPLDKPGVLLLMRLSGRGGSPQQIEQVRSQLDGWDLPDYAAAIAEIARGLSEGKGGPKSGVEFLRKSSRLDLTDPGAAAALRELVRLSRADGAKDTPPELRSALGKHPDAASIQAARGLDRELAADPDEARAAYARALELDPDEVQALLGTGRLAPDRGEAVGLFDRAAAADPTDPEPELEAAKAVAATGKIDDAVRRLDALLVKYPLEGRAASLRVDLDLQRGIATDQTLELARRAARLGGGADELDRVGRVLTQRGDTEEANRIAERAKALREKKAASS
jgi:tetratricopeptide (TPR) repeat protein